MRHDPEIIRFHASDHRVYGVTQAGGTFSQGVKHRLDVRR
jgi:hypothetical protein